MGKVLEEGEGGEIDAEDGGGGGVDVAKHIGKVRVRRWFRIHGMAHRLRLFWMDPDQPWFGISVIFNLTLSLFNFTPFSLRRVPQSGHCGSVKAIEQR